MPRIKILHLIATLDTGGAEVFLSRLARGVHPEKYQNIIVSMTTLGPVGQRIAQNGFPVYALGMKKGLPDPRGLIRLFRLMRRNRIDILLCWMYHANLMGVLVKTVFPGMRLLWNIRCSNMKFNAYGPVYDMTVRAGAFLSGRPDGIIVNSFAGAKFHRQMGYANKKWVVLHNGIDCSTFSLRNSQDPSFRGKLGIPEDAFVITSVARLDPMKDHQTFFRAAGILLQKKAGVHFVLVGRGMDQQSPLLKEWMNGIEKKEHVHLMGERKDIHRIYAISDLACSSSAYGEGFSNAVAEAMASGVPCVVTDTGDSAFIVGPTGLVVPVSDPCALALAWEKMMEIGATGLREIGKKAADRIHEQFRIEGTISRYESVFDQCVHA